LCADIVNINRMNNNLNISSRSEAKLEEVKSSSEPNAKHVEEPAPRRKRVAIPKD